MSTATDIAAPARARSNRRRLVIAAVAVAVVAAIAIDTKVVRIGSELDASAAGFSPEIFGATEFPRIKTSIAERAIDAKTLADAIVADKAAATAQYGVPAGVGPVFPVSFTGVVGEGKSGIFNVNVDGLPDGLKIRMQTGPAINGTDLRDATGDIKFGDFKNQIEYQNAGAAINDVLKSDVLAGLDREGLPGKTVSVVGAFTLINPKNWLVTPVEITVR